MNLWRKGKKRLPSRNPERLAVPPEAKCCWSVNFMHDALMSGQRFRTFNVINDFSRECLAAARVLRVLDRIDAWRGIPEKIRMDLGPEPVSMAMIDRAEWKGIHLEHIYHGKPTQNSCIERFNRTYSAEVLCFYLFSTLRKVTEQTERCLKEYNKELPHKLLGNLTPAKYLEALSPCKISIHGWNQSREIYNTTTDTKKEVRDRHKKSSYKKSL